MFYHAHNGSVRVGNSEMDYISFGYGNRNLIMLPGLGDGLSTVCLLYTSDAADE